MRVPGSLLIEQPRMGDKIPKVSGIPTPEQRSAERPEMFCLVGVMNSPRGGEGQTERGQFWGVLHRGCRGQEKLEVPSVVLGWGAALWGVWGGILWGESIRAQGAPGFSPIKGS